MIRRTYPYIAGYAGATVEFALGQLERGSHEAALDTLKEGHKEIEGMFEEIWDKEEE